MNLTEIHILISPPARLPRTARLGLGRVAMINTLHAYSIAQIIIEVTFIPVDQGYLQTGSALKGDAAQYCVLAYMLLTVSRERHGTGDSSTESGSFSKCLLEQ